MSEPLPPTSAELKALVDAAISGSKAAETRLAAILQEHGELKGRVAKLEEAASKKAAAPPPKKRRPVSDEDEATDGADVFGLLEEEE